MHAADALDTALARVLRDILQCAPDAVAQTKKLVSKARFVPGTDMVEEAALVFSRALQGSEGVEGTMAFVQKRKPNWAAP